jgi:hypothetical protein
MCACGGSRSGVVLLYLASSINTDVYWHALGVLRRNWLKPLLVEKSNK